MLEKNKVFRVSMARTPGIILRLLALYSLVAPIAYAADHSPKAATTSETEIVLDSVLASVNGKPITLHDINSIMKSGRPLSLKEVVSNSEARELLDKLIFQKVLEEEAALRRISVSDGEVQTYLAEVAKRNDMSPEQFETALTAQSLDVETYKNQIRTEILRSRLASQLMQTGAGVSQEEIDRYIAQHPELSKQGTKVKLRQIVVSPQLHADAEKRISEIQEKLQQGESFEKVASEYSDGAEASEGGSLGVVAMEDLSTALFDAVFPLHEGEVTKPFSFNNETRLILLEKRYVESDEPDQRLQDEVRKTLENQKMEVKLNNFFANDITKHHTIDRKI